MIGNALFDIRHSNCTFSLILFIGTGLLGLWFNPVTVEAGEIGVVSVSRLNLRSEPGTAKPPILTLKKGERVQVLKHDKGWLNVQYGGRTGWIINKTSYIRLETDDGLPTTDPEMSRAKKKALDIRRKIQSHKAEVAAFTKKEKGIVNSLNDIDFALNAARKRRKAMEAESAQIDKEMASTELDINMLAEEFDENRVYAARRLVALYKLDRIGQINVLASAASIHELVQRQIVLGRILDNDRKVLMQLAKNQSELRRLLKEQQARKTAKASIQTTLKKEIGEMARKKARRQEILSDVRSQKSLQMAALANLKQSAEALDEKIKMLLLQQVQTEPTFNLPARPFAGLKGLLKMPVAGKIVSKFGQHKNRKFNVVNFRGGIDIKADRGEPVRAVCAGDVVFANWFKGYGNMIIIDHGGGFHTVYANIEEMFKTVGEGAQTGEVVATVGDTGAITGGNLYFEIRQDSKPVDPLKWIAKG